MALTCSKCGADRKVPTYWKDTTLKKRKEILTRLCKKCATGRKPVHGLGTHKLYMAWYNMLIRCGHKKAPLRENVIKNYQDRGITVCVKWRQLEWFAKWAFENGYKDGLWLDRINNNKGYKPSNCRWVTSTVSGQNRRCIKITMQAAVSIREQISMGYPFKVLANIYDVSIGIIKRIAKNETWKGAVSQ